MSDEKFIGICAGILLVCAVVFVMTLVVYFAADTYFHIRSMMR